MPVTLLDIIVISVMLISGILAMVRGLLREVFSILSWAVAAGVTLFFYKPALPYVKQYISQDTAATAATVGILFLGTLLIASILTARISDVVLDSRIGALDRSLGFLFGLARGLLVMVVAFLFFNWLVPTKSQPPWVVDAKSRPALQSAGDWLMAQLPDDPENTILNKLKKQPAPEEGDNPAAPAGGQRSDNTGLGAQGRVAFAAQGTQGSQRSLSGNNPQVDQQGFNQLLESTRGTGH
ncbi:MULTISPECIES: CvpA family protein [Xanthobacter]|uniref:CvpA family protein n=1 Tax=Xanthobacter TaxID=279 RepID=UPI001F395001|nr:MULTISPECIES: CvpA family protein [unclassified Xanthobacter]